MKVTVESFDQLMAVNARGTMLCYKHAAKQMISQGRGGRIIGAYPASFLSYIILTRGIRQGQVRKPESRVIFLPFFALWLDKSSRFYTTANPVAPTYCATKFAIRGLTQAAGMSFFFAEIDASLTRG